MQEGSSSLAAMDSLKPTPVLRWRQLTDASSSHPLQRPSCFVSNLPSHFRRFGFPLFPRGSLLHVGCRKAISFLAREEPRFLACQNEQEKKEPRHDRTVLAAQRSFSSPDNLGHVGRSMGYEQSWAKNSGNKGCQDRSGGWRVEVDAEGRRDSAAGGWGMEDGAVLRRPESTLVSGAFGGAIRSAWLTG